MKLLKKKEGEGGERAKKVTQKSDPCLVENLKKKRKHLNYTAAEATGDMWM